MILLFVFVMYWIPKLCITFAEIIFPNVVFRFRGTTKIHLTIDDVPYDTNTYKEILNILDECNVKATFFIISGQVSLESKRILIEAVRKGHSLANHGHTNTMHALLSFESLTKEIYFCDKMIREIYKEADVTLPKELYYRPGCGIFTNRMFDILEMYGNYRLVLGSVYPNDPILRSSWLNYHYLINHVECGDIVIIHDRTWTPKMLYNFLSWTKSYGYNVSSLP